MNATITKPNRIPASPAPVTPPQNYVSMCGRVGAIQSELFRLRADTAISAEGIEQARKLKIERVSLLQALIAERRIYAAQTLPGELSKMDAEALAQYQASDPHPAWDRRVAKLQSDLYAAGIDGAALNPAMPFFADAMDSCGDLRAMRAAVGRFDRAAQRGLPPPPSVRRRAEFEDEFARIEADLKAAIAEVT